MGVVTAIIIMCFLVSVIFGLISHLKQHMDELEQNIIMATSDMSYLIRIALAQQHTEKLSMPFASGAKCCAYCRRWNDKEAVNCDGCGARLDG